MTKKQSNWLYVESDKNTNRYILGENGSKLIACLGLNPSTATPENLDPTLKKVKNISTFNGFDGWVMYNLYPQRATEPNDMDKEMNLALLNKNINYIVESIKNLKIETIWLAYGDNISKRKYLYFSLHKLVSRLENEGLKVNWKIIEEPTKKGHPRHPLYKKIESKFKNFNMKSYYKDIVCKSFPVADFEATYIDKVKFK